MRYVRQLACTHTHTHTHTHAIVSLCVCMCVCVCVDTLMGIYLLTPTGTCMTGHVLQTHYTSTQFEYFVTLIAHTN